MRCHWIISGNKRQMRIKKKRVKGFENRKMTVGREERGGRNRRNEMEKNKGKAGKIILL